MFKGTHVRDILTIDLIGFPVLGSSVRRNPPGLSRAVSGCFLFSTN